MTSPVIRDISDGADELPSPAPAPDVVTETAFRRFSFDPASSPVLMAALAWDMAGPRR